MTDRSRRRTTRTQRGCLLAAVALALFPPIPRAFGQDVAPPSQASNGPLVDRERDVLARVQRLESTMLKLTKLLAESEPAKAERLKDALDLAGKQRIKARIEAIAALLAGRKLSDADAEQQALLTDFDNLLKTLTNPAGELDARRQEREQLEKLKRSIRTLLDEETQILYRTQQIEKQAEAAGDGDGQAAADQLDKLEEMQRQTERKTAELQKEMQPAPDEQRAARPGAEEAQQADEQMRHSADALGDDKPKQAAENQEKAIQKLQEALDELDDALRQVRKEEMDDTLAAIEGRLRDLLAQEKQVREAIRPLEAKSAADFTRADQSQLIDAAAAQKKAAADADMTLRILIDEGTTIAAPELMKQYAGDIAVVASMLEKTEPTAPAAVILDDVIASLEELLAAVERRRDETRDQQDNPDGQQPQPNDGPQPLLPNSAELKLLRAAQVRVNERMPAAADSAEASAATEFQRLAKRQTELSELTRRMFERKQP
ncbi:MAG: hypothetical protein HZB38_17160 [Planctomycetes bacterium]|nr:hypothetical protein [Planctomycetota bacterium]